MFADQLLWVALWIAILTSLPLTGFAHAGVSMEQARCAAGAFLERGIPAADWPHSGQFDLSFNQGSDLVSVKRMINVPPSEAAQKLAELRRYFQQKGYKLEISTRSSGSFADGLQENRFTFRGNDWPQGSFIAVIPTLGLSRGEKIKVAYVENAYYVSPEQARQALRELEGFFSAEGFQLVVPNARR